VTVHGALCVAANKPCILEEYGTPSNHATIESPWQNAALATKGIAGDMFWQYGDTLSTGQTSNDGNTIYFGSSDFTVLVTNHVIAINGGTPPTSTAPTTTSTASAPSGTGTVPQWGQCGGMNWTGGSCIAPFTCVFQNAFYSQCL
jgi:mannan endo-1,4-beta-mannosidase